MRIIGDNSNKGKISVKKHFCKVFRLSFESFFCFDWETAGCWLLRIWSNSLILVQNCDKKNIELHKVLRQIYFSQTRNLKDFKHRFFYRTQLNFAGSFDRFWFWNNFNSSMLFFNNLNWSTRKKKFCFVRCNSAA